MLTFHRSALLSLRGWYCQQACFAAQAAQKPPVATFTAMLRELESKLTGPEVQTLPGAVDHNRLALNKLSQLAHDLLSKKSAYPPASVEQLTVVVRPPGQRDLRTVSTTLHTTGGDCSASLGARLDQVFNACGIGPRNWYWDEGMWQLGEADPGISEEKLAEARAKATAAGFPSQPMSMAELDAAETRRATKTASGTNPVTHTLPAELTQRLAQQAHQTSSSVVDASPRSAGVSDGSLNNGAATATTYATGQGQQGAELIDADVVEDTSDEKELQLDDMDQDEVDLAVIQENIKQLDPLLGALAAVPWIPTDIEDGKRVPFIKTTLLDEIEGMGWDVRGGVQRIWAGERDLDAIIADKDIGSQLALKTIMQHAKVIEAERGPATL